MQQTFTVPGLSSRVVPADAVKRVEPLLGGVAISWAFLDQVVEFWLVALVDEALRRGIAKKVPSSLDDRLDLLKRCLKTMPEFARIAADCEAVLSQVSGLAQHRHMLTHGVLSHYLSDPEAFVFVKLRYSRKAGIHIAEQEGYTFEALQDMADEARDLTVKMQEYLSNIHARLDDGG